MLAGTIIVPLRVASREVALVATVTYFTASGILTMGVAVVNMRYHPPSPPLAWVMSALAWTALLLGILIAVTKPPFSIQQEDTKGHRE